MKIKIYYGGRGLIDDPTLFVLDKMEEVFKELRVEVERYSLHEQKNSITTLPQTLKDADGIILASTIEWFGVGGFMQQFLDACWLYGDKDVISKIYMCPVVMSTTYGERQGKLALATAWEILGGLPCSGLCGYVADSIAFERNADYISLIEKKAENMYRTINLNTVSLPASNQVVKQMVSKTNHTDLTPQETEQLSRYASDEGYVQQTKEDIKELTNLFRGMMGTEAEEKVNGAEKEEKVADALIKRFKPQSGLKSGYKFLFEGEKRPLGIMINNTAISVKYEEPERVDVEINMQERTMNDILEGKTNFQKSFMSGTLKLKGDFRLLRALDEVFDFS